jgi:hypothetical protein
VHCAITLSPYTVKASPVRSECRSPFCCCAMASICVSSAWRSLKFLVFLIVLRSHTVVACISLCVVLTGPSTFPQHQRRHDCAERAAVGRQPRRLHPRRVRGRDRRLHQGTVAVDVLMCLLVMDMGVVCKLSYACWRVGVLVV